MNTEAAELAEQIDSADSASSALIAVTSLRSHPAIKFTDGDFARRQDCPGRWSHERRGRYVTEVQDARKPADVTGYR